MISLLIGLKQLVCTVWPLSEKRTLHCSWHLGLLVPTALEIRKLNIGLAQHFQAELRLHNAWVLVIVQGTLI